MFSIRHIVMSSAAAALLSVGVVGCQPERPDVVPSTAQMMASADRQMKFVAPEDGTAYVYDHPGQHLLWSGHVMKGQAVDVDPQKNQIMANGSVVSQRALMAGDRNDIYFEASPEQQHQSDPNADHHADRNPGAYNNGLMVMPSVSVQPANGQSNGAVTVQPGLSVAPATQPSNP